VPSPQANLSPEPPTPWGADRMWRVCLIGRFSSKWFDKINTLKISDAWLPLTRPRMSPIVRRPPLPKQRVRRYSTALSHTRPRARHRAGDAKTAGTGCKRRHVNHGMATRPLSHALNRMREQSGRADLGVRRSRPRYAGKPKAWGASQALKTALTPLLTDTDLNAPVGGATAHRNGGGRTALFIRLANAGAHNARFWVIFWEGIVDVKGNRATKSRAMAPSCGC